jgi:hypothetical protein
MELFAAHCRIDRWCGGAAHGRFVGIALGVAQARHRVGDPRGRGERSAAATAATSDQASTTAAATYAPGASQLGTHTVGLGP